MRTYPLPQLDSHALPDWSRCQLCWPKPSPFRLKIFRAPLPAAFCQRTAPGGGQNPLVTAQSGNIDRNTRELGLTGLRGWLATAPRATDRSNLTG